MYKKENAVFIAQGLAIEDVLQHLQLENNSVARVTRVMELQILPDL